MKAWRKFKDWTKVEKNHYVAVGVFFLLLQAMILVANLPSKNWDVFFWYCNHTPLLLAIGFFTARKPLVKGLINVGFLAQITWTVDFLGKLLFDVYVFDLTRYVFEDMSGMIIVVPVLIHIFSTNLALYYTWKRKPGFRVLFYSLIYLILLFGVTLTFATPGKNINCIEMICGFESIIIPGYQNFWTILMFVVIVLPTHGIQYFLYMLSRKSRKVKHG